MLLGAPLRNVRLGAASQEVRASLGLGRGSMMVPTFIGNLATVGKKNNVLMNRELHTRDDYRGRRLKNGP